MTSILYLLFAVVLLGFIVMVHEFGHYMVARLTGVRVEEFAVGMGPKILGWRRKDIDYSLRAIPLGGFCRFVGEDEKSDSPEAFANQKRWKRFLILFAGAGMNFVLAYVAILLFLSIFGVAVSQAPEIYALMEGSPAQAAGVLPGDVVTAVDGQPISYDRAGLDALTSAVARSGGMVELEVQRAGEPLTLQVGTYRALERVYTSSAGVAEYTLSRALMGVTLGRQENLGFAGALRYSGEYFWHYATVMIDGLREMIFGGVGLSQSMGPVGMINTIGAETRANGWQAVLSMTALISLNLGIVNLLPLPALDGGRLVFLLVEILRRKPLPPEKEGLVHGIGFLLLILLILAVTYQDIMRLVTGG